MSLFDSPPDSVSGGVRSSGGLFGDEDTSGDPWSLPAPRTGGKKTGPSASTLLNSTDTPDAYGVLFSQAGPSGDRITFTNLRKMLDNSGLSSVVINRIVELVLPSSSEFDRVERGVSRGEFNVAMALIALAQEGEDITLDSVDERKVKLPIPSLHLKQGPNGSVPDQTPTHASGELTKASIRENPAGQVDKSTSSSLKNVPSQISTTPLSGSASTSHGEEEPSTSSIGQQPSFDSTDPWASGAAHGNSDGLPKISTQVFERNDTHDSNRQRWTTHDADLIQLSVVPEKEGVFMFRHVNYTLTSVKRKLSVVRRYSDFVWLLDCLQRRYPFRQIPLLPPKRLAGTERRKRGLSRFANALVQHPTLSQDQLVIIFLTVPSEISVWKKQANLTVAEEFDGKPMPNNLEQRLPANLEETFENIRQSLKSAAETYIGLCNLMERLEKRHEGIAADLMRFSLSLNTLTDINLGCYAIDNSDTTRLNDGLAAVSKHLTSALSLHEDEVQNWDNGVSEDLKQQRDTLVAMKVRLKTGSSLMLQDLFDRRDKLAGDNVAQLERRIASNEQKVSTVIASAGARHQEIEKLHSSIAKDKDSIVHFKRRRLLIKECICDELHYFQQSQWHVGKLYQDWSGVLIRFAELRVDNWRRLNTAVSEMPTESE